MAFFSERLQRLQRLLQFWIVTFLLRRRKHIGNRLFLLFGSQTGIRFDGFDRLFRCLFILQLICSIGRINHHQEFGNDQKRTEEGAANHQTEKDPDRQPFPVRLCIF